MFGALVGDLFASRFTSEDIDLRNISPKQDLKNSKFSGMSKILFSAVENLDDLGFISMPSVYSIATVMAYKALSSEELKKALKKQAQKIEVPTEYENSFVSFGLLLRKALEGGFKSEIRDDNENSYFLTQAIAAFQTSNSILEAVRNAVVISDVPSRSCIASMAGALAEAYYGLDFGIINAVCPFMEYELWEKISSLMEASPLAMRKKYFLILKYENNLLENISDFARDFLLRFAEKDFEAVLLRAGIRWNEKTMIAADFKNLDESVILALLTGALKAELFSSGALKVFLPMLPLWLGRLKDFDVPVIDKSGKFFSKAVKEIHIEGHCSGIHEYLDFTKDSVLISTQRLSGKIEHRYSFEEMTMKGILTGILNKFSRLVSAPGWADGEETKKPGDDVMTYELTAVCNDGGTVSHLYSFLESLGYGRIMNLQKFNQALKEGEVKYCGCTFSSGGKIYHYRTTDLSICKGDYVIVPVGDENQEKIVKVETIEYCHWDKTPYPLDKTREILRRIVPDGEDMDNTKINQALLE